MSDSVLKGGQGRTHVMLDLPRTLLATAGAALLACGFAASLAGAAAWALGRLL
jgi:hypothetical protein